MSNETIVQELVEQALESDLTPEQTCADHPDLLNEVAHRLKQCRRIDAEIDALFPPNGSGNASASPVFPMSVYLPTIAGYEILGIIGHGGAGVVYKARQLRLDRVVAVKMLLSGPFASAVELMRFVREAKSIAALCHPNIVQVFDVGDVEGRPFYTMEFCEGGTLAQKLKERPLSAPEAVDLICTLASGIYIAHGAGIVHRDLKPGNILLTTDGVPKISDFGLARRSEADSSITLSGAKVGTPSYMSPEQAGGSHTAFPTAVDIYALGAILYELLTGKPPFLSKTAAETQRQIMEEEPVSPTQINRNIPRDLGTICLKCLAKNPLHRYGTAQDMVDDLQRFRRGQPIMARPVGRMERILKWSRRHPIAAAMIPLAIIAAYIAINSLIQFEERKAERRQAVRSDLAQLVALQDSAKWPEAQEVLNRAQSRLEGISLEDMRQVVDAAQRDLNLVVSLDRVRMNRSANGNLNYYRVKADRDYQELFAKSSIAKIYDPVPEVSARIRASNVHQSIVNALDDWAVACPDDKQRRWIFNVANASDPDPTGWRQQIRNVAVWSDEAALNALTQKVPVKNQSVSTLLALGDTFRLVGGNARALLRRVQKENPTDFWANLSLGDSLLIQTPAEAENYFRSALSSRPNEAVGYIAVGDCLRNENHPEDAIDLYRKALAIDHNSFRAENNIGLAMHDAGHRAEAMKHYNNALAMDKNYSWSHFDLANAFKEIGQTDHALAEYRAFLDIEPDNITVLVAYRGFQVSLGDGDTALRSWHDSLQNSTNFFAWAGYPELCLYLGHEDQYQQARTDLLKNFGSMTNPASAEPIARACLLRPCSPDELKQVLALVNVAVAARLDTSPVVFPYYLFAKGLAQYRQGNYEDAIETMKGDAGTVLGPSPQLVTAMCQYRLAHELLARKTLAAAVLSFDWKPSQADRRDLWIYHILRREAESMIIPNLPAFLKGEYQPQTNDTRLALMGICRFKGLYAQSARMYADAFTEDPTLLSGIGVDLRFKAACSASMASRDHSENMPPLADAERSTWRKQALAWLNDDFNQRAQGLESADPAARKRVRDQLLRWQGEPDLSPVRNAAAMQSMNPDDRAACSAFWDSVKKTLTRLTSAK